LFKKNKRILIVEQITYSHEEFSNMQEKVKEKGYEGLMIKKNIPYKSGRSRNLVKVKEFHDKEFIVKEILVNSMRFINEKSGLEETIECLAAVIIDNNGVDVKVGSGFSLSERKEFFKCPENIVGKEITVKYFEETADGSLRFPIFKCIKIEI